MATRLGMSEANVKVTTADIVHCDGKSRWTRVD